MPGSTLVAPNVNQATLPPGALGGNITVAKPAGTLNATYPYPIDKTVPAPVVLTSDAADKHIAQMTTSTEQSNADVANANAIKNAPPPGNTTTDTGNATDTPTQASDYESQINDVLNSLSDGSVEAKPNNLQSNTTDEDQQQIVQDQQTRQTVANSINSINNGTYPLSSSEQAQVAGVADSYQGALATQQQINNIFSAQNNLPGTYAETSHISMSTIENAINSSAKNINDINSRILSAQGKLTQSLLDNDYKTATALYTQIGDDIKDRTTEIDNIQKAIATETATMRDNVKEKLSTLISEQKLDADTKQNAIDNAYKQGMLTIAQKKLADSELAKNVVDSAPQNLPTVTMTGGDTPNVAQQSQFLASLPKDVATLVQGIANYQINPSAIPTRQYKGASGYTQQQMLALVSQYDPSYSQQEYSTRQSLMTNFQSGAYSKNINALNTAIGHIVDLTHNFEGLGNTSFTPYNQAKNSIESLFGSGQPGKAGLNVAAATGELASVFKNSGATDSEIKSLGTLDANSSPAQVKAYQEAAVQLLASRLSALQDTYTAGMGKAPTKSFLSDTNMNSLLKLQQQGLDVQVPDIANAPTVQLQTFHDADPKNASLIDSIMKQNPGYQPSDVVTLLQQEGIMQ